ncbi:MAG: PAS domain S-box protein [Verrucomicrobiota bacterium]|nr:PAS domain S-box protein [Verrucomicrobiota bacterium]
MEDRIAIANPTSFRKPLHHRFHRPGLTFIEYLTKNAYDFLLISDTFLSLMYRKRLFPAGNRPCGEKGLHCSTRTLARFPFRFPVLFLTLFSFALFSPAPTAQTLPLLTNIASIRALSRAEASLHPPLRVQAVVTYYDQSQTNFFVQDGTAGIYVAVTEVNWGLRPGDEVIIDGQAAAGMFMPIIASPVIQKIGNKPLGQPTRVSIAELNTPMADSQRVLIEGVIRSVFDDNGRLIYELVEDGARTRVIVYTLAPRGDRRIFIGRKLRAIGIAGGFFNAEGHIIGSKLLVADFSDTQLIDRQFPDPFSLPIETVASLKNHPEGSRVRIRVIAEDSTPRSLLRAHDQTGSITITTREPGSIRPGTIVEAVGFTTKNNPPLFEDAIFRRLGIAHYPGEPEPPFSSRETTILRTVESIRSLSPEEAARNYPVQLRGVITYYDTQQGLLFFQGSTDGIFVTTAEQDLDLKAGDFVQLRGFTHPGQFAPQIQLPRFIIDGDAPMPVARKASYTELLSGAYDSQWIETQGLLDSMQMDGDLLVLSIIPPTGAGSYRAYVPNFTNKPFPNSMLDGKVTLQGVCGSLFNTDRQLTGIHLFIPSLAFVSLDQPSEFSAAENAVIDIGQLSMFSSAIRDNKRVRIQGSVTYQKDSILYVQDKTAAAKIITTFPVQLSPGEKVDVSGYPVPGEFSPVIQHATVIKLGLSTSLDPLLLSPDELVTRRKVSNNGKLVKTSGTLIGKIPGDREIVLALQSGQHIFNASFQGRDPFEALRPGSEIELTGLLLYQLDEQKIPQGFRILLRSPDDVTVTKAPPWWTTRHTIAAIFLLTSTVSISMLWVYALRTKVKKQTALLKENFAKETLLTERFKKLVQNAHDLIFTLDPQGRIHSINDAGRNLLMLSPDETSLTIQELAAPGSLPLIEEWLRAQIATPQSTSTTLQLCKRSGAIAEIEVTSQLLVETDGKTLLQVIGRDITERKAAERALKQSEERFSKAFRSSPTPVSISRLDGNQVDVNDAFLKTLEYDLTDIVKPNFHDFLWADLSQREAVRRKLHEGISVRNQEVKLLTKTGKVRTFITSCEPIEIHGYPSAIMILHDITDRLVLEEQYRHAQRMEAVGQLAAGIAHDFNNLLTIIQGHASLVRATAADATLVESAEEIAAASDSAAKLTRQLLTFSRRQIIVRKNLNLNDVIEQLGKMLRRILGEHITLSQICARDLPLIYADAGMMEQLLMNLVVNARDAMPIGGNVTISTSACRFAPDQSLQHAEARPGDFVCLEVTDNGHGMDEKTQKRLFEPFFTTKPVGKGTGLGLATVYGIIKDHGGWIEVISSPGKGARFRIFFPALVEQETSKDDGHTKRIARGGSETILLVEDEKPLRLLSRTVLSRLGYKVVEAESGVEALERWKEIRNDVDLLLTDMVMPGGVSGKDLAQFLCNDRKDLKVIFSSGYSVDLQELDLHEDSNFLPKPYNPDKLAKIIRACLDKKS